MAEDFKDQVEFLLVYIREAHATDGRQAPANVRDNILLEYAKTEEQKDEYASSCVRNLGIEFPAVVDALDNAVERSYTAWPDRLYLIGKDGKIKYKSAPGPRGFRPPELEAAIKLELSR